MIEPREADRLAQRARAGEAAALARLYQSFAPAVLAYLRRLLGPSCQDGDAEDILHDTFLRLCQGRGPDRMRGRFRQWLFTVAANAARDHQRRDRRRRNLNHRVGEELSAFADSGRPTPDEQYATREALALVESALADLPKAYAAAFHLRLREGFSYREMAAITGEAEGTLRSRVHHSLKQLRTRLVAVGNLQEQESTRDRNEE